MVADAEVRHLLVVERDHPILADLLHEDFGDDVLLVVRQEGAARVRLQVADAVGGFLDVHDVLVQRAGDLGEAAAAQRLHVAGDNLVFERLLPTGALQLEFQALAQIARGDAGGWKLCTTLSAATKFSKAIPVEAASSSRLAVR